MGESAGDAGSEARLRLARGGMMLNVRCAVCPVLGALRKGRLLVFRQRPPSCPSSSQREAASSYGSLALQREIDSFKEYQAGSTFTIDLVSHLNIPAMGGEKYFAIARDVRTGTFDGFGL
eukprot:COSAG01_NODE_9486_length_2434_cov_21.517773_1_plen_119_part_10